MTGINHPKHIAPLAVLRIAFGLIMLISTLRFIFKGWISSFYIKPVFHFTFYGFDWVKPLGAMGMYTLFIVMALTALTITLGLFYRLSITAFFLCFTYTELIDKTTYLNHYYFVSIIAFLMILVPAHRCFSLDNRRRPALALHYVPAWMINIFKVQLVLVYFFAGLSKLNHDWLNAALPLRIWLPANSDMPIVGQFFGQLWVAFLFSWFGAIFDLSIGCLLLQRCTRKIAYLVVIVFHVVTALLFKIGMFPYIMIAVTMIFFSEDTHIKIISWLKRVSSGQGPAQQIEGQYYHIAVPKRNLLFALLSIYFMIQCLMPLRYLCYPGALYWTEEGYRFSWRVMLMEKAGTAFFYIKDPKTGKRSEVNNAQYLSNFQETMMSTQPDMILQYAHFLSDAYKKKGISNPVVTVESYVTLNGAQSRLYIDSTINLAQEQENMSHKRWILPFHKN